MTSPRNQQTFEDEPRTPTWLTALGVGLFALAGLAWLATRPSQPTVEQMRGAAIPGDPASAPSAPIVSPPPASVRSQPAAAPSGQEPAIRTCRDMKRPRTGR